MEPRSDSLARVFADAMRMATSSLASRARALSGPSAPGRHVASQLVRGEEAKAIKKAAGFKARRWVVERAHSGMNRFRRVLVRWEKRGDTYLAMLHLACGIVTWRAAGLLG